MNPEVSGAGTGESEQAASEQTQSLSSEILSLMKGEEPVAAAPKQEVPDEVPTPAEEEIPQQTQETEEESQEEEAAEVAAGQWPVSAKKRVAEENDKKKRAQARADRAESERDQWQQRAAQLEAQLAEAAGPRPTREDPLADVLDFAGLEKAKGHYETIKSLASRALDKNPTLDEIEVVVGKNPDGSPRTELKTRDQLIDYREDADYALRTLIPAREQVLVARQQADAMALKVYPEFAENEGDNQWSGFVRDTIALHPSLAKVPDIAIWLGHALTGRRVTLERLVKQYGNNGEKVPDIPSITASPKFKKAPPISTGRVPSQSTPRRGADVEAARKAMRARPGDDDAMESFIDAKLFRSPSRGYTKI